jgi:hypothetical protein
MFTNGVFAQEQTPAQTADTTSHQAHLPLVVGPGGLSSATLIADALARGEIDSETALIYRVFANFNDPRLPARFQGDDSRALDSELMPEIDTLYAQLSPQARETLQPFFIPPYHSGSWWDLQGQPAQGTSPSLMTFRCDDLGNGKQPLLRDWNYIDADNGQVRIWWQDRYPEDAPKARALAEDVGLIWAHLGGLMRRFPPSDQGGEESCRGGSDRYDISLVDLDNMGETAFFERDILPAGPWPSFILMKRDVSEEAAQYGLSTRDLMRAALIHELMHAFQRAFAISDLNEYFWWNEATSIWAIHYVENLEPSWRTNYEHRFADQYFQNTNVRLEIHSYSGYLFPFFIQLYSGQSAWVGSSYERSETMTDSYENLNGLIGGFQDQWPRFTLANLNKPPFDKYQTADGLTKRTKFLDEQVIDLAGGGARDYELNGKVKQLSSHSFHYTITDPKVRSLLFVNPFTAGGTPLEPTANVRALVKIGGQWKEENWTTKPAVAYCRDLKAERVEELMIVISNSEWADRAHVLSPARPPRLHATNVACRGWTLEATMAGTTKGPSKNQTNAVTTTATLLRYVPPGDRYHGDLYKVTSGTVRWSHTGTESNCSGKGEGSYSAVNPLIQAELYVESFNIAYLPPFVFGSRKYEATGAWSGSGPPLVAYHCPNNQVFDHIPHVTLWLQTNHQGKFEQTISADGTTLEGQNTMPPMTDGVATTTIWSYKWKFVALPPE